MAQSPRRMPARGPAIAAIDAFGGDKQRAFDLMPCTKGNSAAGDRASGASKRA